MTVHTAGNTDDPHRLMNILTAFDKIEYSVIFPVHPRTKRNISDLGTKNPQVRSGNVRFVDSVSFLNMIELEKNAKVILTDSGGIQKEAYFHWVPCVTLRDESEWIETVEAGGMPWQAQMWIAS